MERMTFYIPPVFLFGSNANRLHNEKEKSEYKTAAETEIKVENWRAKRIAELEEEIEKLKKDNKRLREGVDAGQKLVEDLISKNKNLKEELKDKQKVIQYYRKDKKLMGTQIKKLKEELRKYKKQYQHSMGFSDFGGYEG